MKIAFVDEDLSPRTGSRRFTCEVTRRLQDLGNEVEIFTSRLDERLCFQEYLSMPVNLVPKRKPCIIGTSTSRFRRTKENSLLEIATSFVHYLSQARNAINIGKRIADTQCDVALFQYHGEHWLLPYFCHLTGPSGVVYLNVVPPSPPPFALPFQELTLSRRIVDGLFDSLPIKKLEQLSFQKLGLFITPSNFQLEQGRKQGVIGKKKAAVVPLGVDHDRFYPVNKSETFALYLGRIHPHKSLELALASMKDTPPDWSLVIAGDIENHHLWYKGYLISLAEELKIADRFKMVISPSDSQVVQLMQQCSVFLFPSTIDTFGLVVLEAMACGKPIVACDRGGVPEIVGQAGFLIEPNVLAWQRTVARLLSDSTLRREMGKRAIERSKCFSWQSTAKNLLQAFENLSPSH